MKRFSTDQLILALVLGTVIVCLVLYRTLFGL